MVQLVLKQRRILGIQPLHRLQFRAVYQVSFERLLALDSLLAWLGALVRVSLLNAHELLFLDVVLDFLLMDHEYQLLSQYPVGVVTHILEHVVLLWENPESLSVEEERLVGTIEVVL